MMSGDRWKAANMKSDSLFLTYKNVTSGNLEYGNLELTENMLGK